MCLSCFKTRDKDQRHFNSSSSPFHRSSDGADSDFGGSEHSRSQGKKKRIVIRKKAGGSDAGTADDSDYTHETQSLLGKSESNDSSEGGLLNSRQSRSIASSSSGHNKGSSYQQVQLHALHFFDCLNVT